MMQTQVGRPGDPATRRPGLIILSGHSTTVVNPHRDMTPGAGSQPRTAVVTSVQTLCNRPVMAISRFSEGESGARARPPGIPVPASRICTGIAHPAKDPVRLRAHRTGHPRARSPHGTGTAGAPRPSDDPVESHPVRVLCMPRSAARRGCARDAGHAVPWKDNHGLARAHPTAEEGAPGVLGTAGTSARLRSVDGPMRRPAAWAWAVPAGLRRASARRPKTPGAVPTGGTNEGCARSDAKHRPRGRLCESGPSPACAWSAPPRPRRWCGEDGPLRRLTAGAMRDARGSACEGSGADRRGCRLSLPRPALRVRISANRVVTGAKIGLRASGGKGIANNFPSEALVTGWYGAAIHGAATGSVVG